MPMFVKFLFLRHMMPAGLLWLVGTPTYEHSI
jgi:hypothetical protein